MPGLLVVRDYYDALVAAVIGHEEGMGDGRALAGPEFHDGVVDALVQFELIIIKSMTLEDASRRQLADGCLFDGLLRDDDSVLGEEPGAVDGRLPLKQVYGAVAVYETFASPMKERRTDVPARSGSHDIGPSGYQFQPMRRGQRQVGQDRMGMSRLVLH